MQFKKNNSKSFNVYSVLFSIFYMVGCGGDSSLSQTSTIPTSQKNERPRQLPSITNNEQLTPVEYFLEQFFKLCETDNQNEYYPFSLSIDFRNMRFMLSPQINEWKNLSPTEFITAFNEWDGLCSHLYLKKDMSAEIPVVKPPQNNPKITYLCIEDFEETYSSGFIQDKMKEAYQTNKLIIDLRTNLGGRVDYGGHFLSFFLGPKIHYGYFLIRDNIKDLNPSDYGKAPDAHFSQKILPRIKDSFKLTTVNEVHPIFNGKIAILVNRYTSSTPEIVSYVLQIMKRNQVKIFGELTNGSVQKGRSISVPILNTTLFYPTGAILMLNGKSLEGKGVTADESADENNSIEKATQWLESV